MTLNPPPRRASRLRTWKRRGDNIIWFLFVGHGLAIGFAIAAVIFDREVQCDQKTKHCRPHRDYVRRILVNQILASEFFNFLLWYLKFIPLFLLLFPIHRAMRVSRASRLQ